MDVGVQRSLGHSDEPALPDPCDPGLYVRYVETCRRAGVEPVPPHRVRELVGRSKVGCIWPTEYWKGLIDSFCCGGARVDPSKRYRAFAVCLSSLTRNVNGRFVPTTNSPLEKSDDVAIRSLSVVRVTAGNDNVAFHDPYLPSYSGWHRFDFPYLGTIGGSKAEQQSKENRLALAARESDFVGAPSASGLWLHIQLSARWRDRDLDNLADALMPFFNKLSPKLCEVNLSKMSPGSDARERIWVHLRTASVQ